MENKIHTIWITGLSSSGKTTLARLMVEKLKENNFPALLIDGAEARDLFNNEIGFDPDSRRKQTARIKQFVLWTMNQSIFPVVSIIHPFEDDRIKCRNDIQGYFEVYLKCDIDECVKRDKKNVYMPAIQGDEKFVVGMDILYDKPTHADMTLESDILSPESLIDTLWENVKNRIFDNRLQQP